MKLGDIKLIVYDFDGVMTDNRVIIDQYGNESVIVNRSDGLAISKFHKMGIIQIIISTEKNQIVQKRAEKLKIICLNGIEDKLMALKSYLIEKNISNKNIVYVGNDINDLKVMQYIDFPIAPADAYPEIKSIAKFITKASGGEGVIRELLDVLLKENIEKS